MGFYICFFLAEALSLFLSVLFDKEFNFMFLDINIMTLNIYLFVYVVCTSHANDKRGSCRSFWIWREWIRRQKKWIKWRRKGKKLNLVSRRHIVLNILFHYTELCVFTRDYEFFCHSTVASYRIYCRSHFLSSSQDTDSDLIVPCLCSQVHQFDEQWATAKYWRRTAETRIVFLLNI